MPRRWKKKFEKAEPPSSSALEVPRREILPGDRLILSKRQQNRLVKWKRMRDIGITQVFCREPHHSTIKQGAVGDCSFLAAICALSDCEAGRQLLKSSITEVSDGRFLVRMYFEGEFMNVEVDDWVPTGAQNKLIVAYSEGEMWVTLLEKAFVKIMGGSYDVSGSNPNTDAYHITGWVPETLVLSEMLAQDANDAWNSLVHGTLIGCLGTMKVSDAQMKDAEFDEGVSRSTGLVEDHAYSILRVDENSKLLFVRNSWGKQRWSNRYGVHDEIWDTSFSIPGYDIQAARARDDGCFWIRWTDVCTYFSHLYLLHNPAYLHKVAELRQERFEPGEESILPDDTHCTAWNPQYLIKTWSTPRDVMVYIVLTRLSSHNPSYITMHAWKRSTRGYTFTQALRDGVYSAGQSVLLKIKADGEFVIFVSQHQRKTAFDFSLACYLETQGSVTMERLPFSVKSNSRLWGSWTDRSAGGSTNDPTYDRNPAFRLEVTRTETILIFLESLLECTLNLRLYAIEGMGASASQPTSRRHLLSSGAYVTGCCCIGPVELGVGIYRLVASTYRPTKGDFRIDLRALYATLEPMATNLVDPSRWGTWNHPRDSSRSARTGGSFTSSGCRAAAGGDVPAQENVVQVQVH